MYQFPWGFITNHHKFRWLKGTRLLLPSQGSGGRSFLAFSHPLMAANKPWSYIVCTSITDLYLHLHMAVFPLCMCQSDSVLSSWKSTRHWIVAYPNPVWSHLNQLHMQSSHFQTMSNSEFLGASEIFFRTQFNPILVVSHNNTDSLGDCGFLLIPILPQYLAE